MKIVIATPILFDKTSPFNHLFKDMIEGFLADGNEVTRIVAVENENDTEYKLEVVFDSIRYIPVIRKPAGHAKIIKRYVMDTLTSIKMAKRIKSQKNSDVLFEDVSYSSFWTVRAAKKNGMKVVAMLQDIWPDNAVSSGIIKEGSILYRYFEMWQRYVYKKADKIISISDDMKQFIASKGVNPDKIEVIYNWGYSDEIVDISWRENEFVRKYNLNQEKFYAIYAGNIGRMQNVELIVEAAKILKNNDKIHFLIIGDGVKKKDIEALIAKYSLDNVQMLPMQPSTLATSVYFAAGVNIVPLVEGGVKTALPSKTGVVLSCGRPVIFAFGIDCEFSKQLMRYDAGVSVSASDSSELAKRIQELSNQNITRVNGALDFFKKEFVQSINVQKYVEIVLGR